MLKKLQRAYTNKTVEKKYNSNGNCRPAFTKAELLIALGIIGVVALVSIPILIANTNPERFRSQFKKSISSLNQAVLLSQARYNFDFASVVEGDGLNPKEEKNVSSILSGTLSSVTILENVVDYSPSMVSFDGLIQNPHFALMADGSMFVYSKKATDCTVDPGEDPAEYIGGTRTNGKTNLIGLQCSGYIDVNAMHQPNEEAECKDAETEVYGGDNDCTVPNNAAYMKDVYRVVFHDGVVEPATNAARYVLATAK